jgi:HAMP domain-containing protein
MTGQALQTLPISEDPFLVTEGISILSVVPMRAGGGSESDSVLVGVNSGLRLSALMTEIQAFWEERGIYLVERGGTFLAIEPNIIVQLPRYETNVTVQTMDDHPVFEMIETTNSGTDEYLGLEGNQVFGAFEWIPDWGMGVVIELPQEEVFSELITLAPFSAGLVAIAGVLSVLIVSFATNRMLQPLAQLTEFASRISRGEWQTRVPETRKDEIGELARSFNRMAIDLSGMYQSLEERVNERTRQIRTAAEVARAVTSTPALDVLLQRAVELIRDRFNYYHASIFLLDDEGKTAILAESTGEVGQAMKARGHALEVGSQSIIGWVTANNTPRIASDVGEDPVHLANEFLPETRSEAAVPLQVGGTILGALDVQSTEAEAFREEDIEILQTLADQLSAAIQNAKLAETSVEAAERARMISDVTSQLSGMMDVKQVLQTTAQALHRTLGGKEIVIQMTTDGEPIEEAE